MRRVVWSSMLVVLVAVAGEMRAADLGPLLSECVGSECPLLSAYPNPNMFPGPPATWRGHDEAFSAVVLGHFTLPATGAAETEGRMAIGGDFLPARGYSVGISGGGTFVVGPRVGFNNLIVRGAATGTNNPFVGTVATLGTTVTGLVVVGGAASGITFDMGVLTANVGTSPAALGIDLDTLFAGLRAKSQCWSLLMSTGTLVDEVSMGNGWVLRGDGTSLLQVFNLSSTALNIPAQVLSFDQIPTGATVLVTIAGTAPVISIPLMNVTTTTSPTVFNVLFNCPAATNLTVNGDLNASLLAPFANTTLNANVNGRVALGGNVIFSGGGFEIHNYPFTGDLPECGATPTATATATATATQSATATATQSVSATSTESPTATQSATGTATQSATSTATQSATATATESATATATESATATVTESATATQSATVTATHSATASATQTATATQNATASSTATVTATGTATGTASATVTASATATATATVPTSTATATPPPGTPTATRTITQTPTITGTASATATQTRRPPIIEPTPEPGDTTVDCEGQPGLDPAAGCIQICLGTPGIDPRIAPCQGAGNPLGQGGTNAAGECIGPGGLPGISVAPLDGNACIYPYDACNNLVGPLVCLGLEQVPALEQRALLLGTTILLGVGLLALARRRRL